MGNLPNLEVLTQDEVERIYEGALWVLENVGIRVEDKESRDYFRQAGARVDEDTRIAKIPRQAVEQAREMAPNMTRHAHRDGNVMEVGGDNQFHGTSATMLDIMDYGATEPRRSNKQDCVNIARIVDNLPSLDFGSHTVQAWDVPEPVAALHGFEAVLANTSKHCLASPHDLPEAQAWTDLAEIANEGRTLEENPIICIATSTTAPLQIDWDSAKVMVHAVKKGVPLIVLPMPLAGGTAPVTLAGALVMENAEALSVLVLSQAIRPGAPFLYGAVCTIMDLRTGAVAFAAPEFPLFFTAKAQMGRFLGVPSYCGIGSVDSVRVDVQAGLEAMLSYLPYVLSGLNFSVSAGGIGSAKVYSYEMVVIDHDIRETCLRIKQGIRVTDETLALDVIKEIGHGQHFLNHPHTVEYIQGGELDPSQVRKRRRGGRGSGSGAMRYLKEKEHYYSPLFDRWSGEMQPSMLERAHAQVQKILREHKPNVPDSIIEDMRRYVEETEKKVLSKH